MAYWLDLSSAQCFGAGHLSENSNFGWTKGRQAAHLALVPLDSAVDGMRIALLRFKQIAEPTAKPAEEAPSTTSRVLSFELLPTASTFHSSESGSVKALALSRAFAKLWQRLYVHKMTVIFLTFLGSSLFGRNGPRLTICLFLHFVFGEAEHALNCEARICRH